MNDSLLVNVNNPIQNLSKNVKNHLLSHLFSGIFKIVVKRHSFTILHLDKKLNAFHLIFEFLFLREILGIPEMYTEIAELIWQFSLFIYSLLHPRSNESYNIFMLEIDHGGYLPQNVETSQIDFLWNFQIYFFYSVVVTF